MFQIKNWRYLRPTFSVCPPTESQTMPWMWNKHVNPPSPATAAWVLVTDTTHLFPFQKKKESLSKSLANPLKEAFWLSGYIAKSFFFLFFPRFRALKKTTKTCRQRRQRRLTKRILFVISVCVCVTWKNQKRNANDAWKPPDSLKTRLRLMCFARVLVDARNLPVDSAGQRTFSPVGGIIPTAAESAGRRVFSGGLG